ncbi:hypothetical protein K523DRAFT_325878 [Schizophyllum commune Tattone D]|nr:hypothetical protein K523DRAFT_325878 [Schizophyllum commune Tattone D]
MLPSLHAPPAVAVSPASGVSRTRRATLELSSKTRPTPQARRAITLGLRATLELQVRRAPHLSPPPCPSHIPSPPHPSSHLPSYLPSSPLPIIPSPSLTTRN